MRNFFLDVKDNHNVVDNAEGYHVRFLLVSQQLNSFFPFHTMQIVLKRAAAGCKKTMTYEKKDTTNNEHPARIKRPRNSLAESMPTFEFARIYYDGP